MAIQLISSLNPPQEEKPREKILHYGAESLNDVELLSVILGTGYEGMKVKELARYLLANFGTHGLFQFRDFSKFQENTGLPFVKSCVLIAISEVMRRIQRRDDVKIKSSEQFYEYIKDDFKKNTFEQLRIVCVDTQRRVLFNGLVAQGEFNTLSVTLSAILHHPIRLNVKNFYLAHNHPLGIKKSSREDIAFTLQIREESKKFGLSFDDHIIIGEDGFCSFSLKGVL